MAGASPSSHDGPPRPESGPWTVYFAIVNALAFLASVVLALMFIAMITDVVQRMVAARPAQWPVPVIEYMMHFLVLFGAPYALTKKSHVLVDSFVQMMPLKLGRLVEKAGYVISLVACLIFAAFSATSGLEAWEVGGMDVRAISIPEYVLYLPMVVSFLLLAFGFLYLLTGRDSLMGLAAVEKAGA